MSAWRKTTLGAVADLLVGFAFKSANFTNDVNDVRLLRGVNIGQGVIDWNRVAFWPNQDLEASRYHLAEDDVVLAMDRPWIEAGLKRARIRRDDLPALLVQRVARLRGTDKIRTSFIHHLLATEEFSRYLQAIVTGATVPHISQSQIESFGFLLPELGDQDRICVVLDSIDHLIENNRRQVEVLEEMARAIYCEWFIHFRYPGSENAPLVESALGPIPRAWEVGRVDSHFVLQRGFDLPASARESGSVPIIGASGVQGFHSAAKAQGPGLTTGRSGTVGVVTYVPSDFWPLNTSLWVKEFRLSTPRFAYFLLSSLDLAHAASGAAVPTLNRNVVHALAAVCPPRKLIEEWDLAAAPMFDSMEVLRRQNRSASRWFEIFSCRSS